MRTPSVGGFSYTNTEPHRRLKMIPRAITHGTLGINAKGRQVELRIWIGIAGRSESTWIDLGIEQIDQAIAALTEQRDKAQAYLAALPRCAATYPTEAEQEEFGITADQLLVTDIDDFVKAWTEPVVDRRLGNAITALTAAGYEILDALPNLIDGSLEYTVRAL